MKVRVLPALLIILGCVPVDAPAPRNVPDRADANARAAAITAFETVRQVLQHPRCQNCHIPGDAPLQFDAGIEHAQLVKRGPDGKGAPGLPCSSCHNDENPPASYGPHAPPGAPTWFLPPPDQKMVFINVPAAELCATVKNPRTNGGKDWGALIHHVAEDELVGWGWHPGGNRAPVPIPRAEFVAAFRTWAAVGGPCPGDPLGEKIARR